MVKAEVFRSASDALKGESHADCNGNGQSGFMLGEASGGSLALSPSMRAAPGFERARTGTLDLGTARTSWRDWVT